MILERRPIHFSFAVCGFYHYNVWREREGLWLEVRWGTAGASAKAKAKADPPPSAKDDNKEATTKVTTKGNSKVAKRQDIS
jgi:hypothetical protein